MTKQEKEDLTHWEHWLLLHEVDYGTPKQIKSAQMSQARRYLETLGILSSRRHRNLVTSRQIVAHFLMTDTSLGYTDVANTIRKDHATIIWAYKRIEDLLSVDDPELRAALDVAQDMLDKLRSILSNQMLTPEQRRLKRIALQDKIGIRKNKAKVDENEYE